MLATKRLCCRRAFVSSLLVGSAACLLAAYKAEDGAEWYVRPLKPERLSKELFETIGVDSVGFEFRLPKGKKAAFLVVARDANGKIIENLSYAHAFMPRGPNEINDGEFQITRIDPSALIEGYKGKVRWVVRMRRGTQGTAHTRVWEKNHFVDTINLPAWSSAEEVSRPELGREYSLCRMEAYPEGLDTIVDDSPTVFDLRVSFKLEESSNGLWGNTSHRPYRDQ